MEFNQYQKEVVRTFAFRKTPLNQSTTDMLHCAIGICTEVGELEEAFGNVDEEYDFTNIGEEIGDQMWYISNLSNYINLNMEDRIFLVKPTYYESNKYYLGENLQLSCRLMDIFKKHIYYNKELNTVDIKDIIFDMVVNLNNLSHSLGLDLKEIMNKNISKLRIRFPEKFTEELAENRNLNEERKSLES